MEAVSSFNMLVTVWLSRNASAKYILKLMQQQSKMCNSNVSAKSHAPTTVPFLKLAKLVAIKILAKGMLDSRSTEMSEFSVQPLKLT
jgi:hypothetical protein